MPKTRPSPRLGLQGQSQAAIAYSEEQHRRHRGGDHEVARLLGPQRPGRGSWPPQRRVEVTRSRSLKEMRTAEPCGHICTQAGPSGRPRHRSHLVASSTGLPSGRFSSGLDHRDVAPRAAVGAVAAADAGGLVDRDLERAHPAGDGARRAVHHADGVGALVAGGGHQPVAVALALADEAGWPPWASAQPRTHSSQRVQVERSMRSTLSPWMRPVSMAICRYSEEVGLRAARAALLEPREQLAPTAASSICGWPRRDVLEVVLA